MRHVVRPLSAILGSALLGGCLSPVEQDEIAVQPPVDPIVISVAGGDSATEGGTDGGVAFSIVLSEASTGPIDVSFETRSGTATSGDDFVAQAAVVTIPAGATSADIAVAIIDDALDENDETIELAITAVSDGQLDVASASGTILDNDGAVTLSISNASITEGDSGESTLSFPVSLNTPSGRDISVDYSTANVTATAGIDYVANSGRMLISAGAVSGSISVVVIGDVLDEIDESFSVVLSNPSNAVLGVASASGQIVNDDVGAPPVVAASIGTPAAVIEADGASLVFPVSLTIASAADVVIQYQTGSSTATADLDYVASAASITILAGAQAGTISIPLLNDAIDEPDETVEVDLVSVSSGVIATGSAIGVIVDDDAAPSISVADASTLEGDTGQLSLPFTLSLSAPSGFDVSASYQTLDVSASAGSDYESMAGVVTIPAGSQSAAININVNGDTIAEPDETFSLALGSPVNVLIADGDATGLILNDDDVPTLSVDDVNIAEGDSGQSDLVFTVSLSDVAGVDVTFDIASTDGTATAGSDYVSLSTNSTILAGSRTTTVVVPVLGDTITEADETLTVALSNAVNATIADGVGLGSIFDDDGVSVLSISDASIIEGDSGQSDLVFTASLSNVAAQDITFDIASADGTASAGSDYVAISTNATIVAGNLTTTAIVPILGDTDEEPDETLSVSITNATNATIADGVGLGTILNDDVTPPVLSLADATVAEGDSGQTDLVFNVLLDRVASQDVTFDVATSNGTATAGTDYVAVSTNGIIVTGSQATTVIVPVLGDTDEESDETLLLNISNVANASIGDGAAIGTIQNDDIVVPAVLSISDASMAEGDSGQSDLVFTVSLDRVASQNVTFGVVSADGTAAAGSDYVALSTSGTILAGDLTTTVELPIIGDTAQEADETLTVALTSAVNATVGDGVGVGTIVNDDATALPLLSIADAAVAEGNSGQSDLVFTVSLDTTSSQNVTFDFASSDGSAIAGSDYVSVSTGATILAGSLTTTVVVSVLGDSVEEPDETLSVTVSNVVNATLADDVALGTILNDDAALSAVSIADASVAEGDSGQTSLVFAVTLDSAAPQDVSFDVATSDASATAGSDYTALNTAGSILSGSLSTTVTVLINGDTDPESDETFGISLSNVTNAAVSRGAATGTIVDDDSDGVSGLASRPANGACVAPDRPITNTSIGTEDAFPNLPFLSRPLGLLQAPGDSSQWYVVEKAGRVLRFDNTPSASGLSTFIDISSPTDPIDVDSSANESGLLGMAFHPDYGNSNWYVYLSYTIDGSPVGASFISVISRFESKDNGLTLDATDAVTLLTLEQPFVNHNGGHIAFGPDGMLYIGFGDGSGSPPNPAIATNSLLGSILRIDVDSGSPYSIPSDNPFAGNPLCSSGAGSASCPEIYAWGFRNPWKWSFDDVTGTLWLGDVGEVSWEEIDQIENGGNYGWFCREGAHDFAPNANCPTNLIDPVIEYPHSVGRSVTGGFVYRGTAIPQLTGRYVFGDYIEGKLFASVDDGNGGLSYEELLDTSFFIAAFAQEANGELLFLRYSGGDIRRVIQSGGNGNDTIPTQLSDTGCVDASDPTQPASGLIPYDINAPFWSDNAVKDRWYAIPDSATIDVDTDGDWQFPVGSVLMKNFRLNGSLIETRLFMRHPDGEWGGYTYEWNSSGTDATRVIGGKTKSIGGQDWIYPNGTQCLQCHTEVAGYSLGLEHGQLNKNLTYPSTGINANQLVTADAVDLLTAALPGPPATLPRYPDPDDASESLEDRARSYLHSNCAGCHQAGGPTPSTMDLHFNTALQDTNTCDVLPASGDLGIANARIISPGNASASLLVVRTSRRDIHGMPPLGSTIIDDSGVQLLTSWVNSLSSCP